MKKIVTDFKLAASIAFVHMGAKLKQTIIATIGVALGITIFVFMVGFIQGSQNYMQAIMFEQSPHLRLFNEVRLSDKTIIDKIYPHQINTVGHQKPKDIFLNLKDGKQAVKDIRKNPLVKTVSGSVRTKVFYRLGAVAINGTILGINFEEANALFNLENKIVSGSFAELSTMPNSIVVGTGLAKKLNVKTGDKIELTTEKGANFSISVIGIFKTGLVDIDNQQSYGSIKTVQRFLNVPSSYLTDIQVKLFDPELAPNEAKRLQKNYNYSGSDWKKDNVTLLESASLQNMITYNVAGVILLIAGFGIFNILTMMIYEKMKDIAILKAIGFSNGDVRRIFLTQAFVIGIIGAFAGLIFGYLISYAISKMPYHSDVMFSLDHLPVSFNPLYYIMGFSFGILTTAVAGYLPSRKAAKVDPITILRG